MLLFFFSLVRMYVLLRALQEVLANAQLFVLAGYETTANTLTFAIYLLAKHPEWQDRLYAEVAAAAAAHRIPGSQRIVSPFWSMVCLSLSCACMCGVVCMSLTL